MAKPFQRARSDEAKQARRRAILSAALRSFEMQSYDDVTVDGVARISRLAKGTVYLYFPTKEAIFLELLLIDLELWFESLAAPLDALVSKAERASAKQVRAVSDLLARSMGERRTLRRLLSLLHQTFERNVDVQTVRSFKLRLAEAMQPTAARLEKCLPQLRHGDGFRLLLHLHGLVIGVGQMSETSDVVDEVLRQPDLAAFRVDFVTELRELLQLVLSGWPSVSAPPRDSA